MIQKVRLVNFMPYTDAQIELDEVTSLCGDTNHGKTTWVRALEIVLFNKDFPPRYIRHGQKRATIEVHLDDGSWIKKERTQTGQTTTVHWANGREAVYTGKMDASEAITEVTNIKKIVIDAVTGEENVNSVSVHDRFYNTNLRPNILYRRITAIVGAASIEIAKTNLLRQRQQKTEARVKVTENLKRAQEKLRIKTNEALTLEQMVELVNQAEEKLRAMEHANQTLATGIQEVEQWARRESDLTDIEASIAKLVQIDGQISAITKIIQLQMQLGRWMDLNQAKIVLNTLEVQAGTIAKIEKLLESMQFEEYCPQCGQPVGLHLC